MLVKQKLGIISRTNFELRKSTCISLIMMLLKYQNTPQINIVLRMFQLYIPNWQEAIGWPPLVSELNLWELKTNPAGHKRRVLVCYWLVKFLLNRRIFGLASAPKSPMSMWHRKYLRVTLNTISLCGNAWNSSHQKDYTTYYYISPSKWK